MIYKFVLLVTVFFSVLSDYSFAQIKPQEAKKRPAASSKEDTEAKKIIKNQAIQSLRDILENGKNYEDVWNRGRIVARSSEVLWKYDAVYAKEKFTREFKQILSDYEASFEDKDFDKEKQSDSAATLREMLKTLARKDAPEARKLQAEFLAVQKKIFGKKGQSNRDLYDGLKAATEGLELSAEESAALALQIIGQGVPSNFTEYLLELKKKNPQIADNLYRQALNLLLVSSIYDSTDAVHLAGYAFNDPFIFSVSLVPPDANNPAPTFGIFSSIVFANRENTDELLRNLIAQPPNRVLAQAYLNTVGNFLSKRFLENAEQSSYTQEFLLTSAYLVKKSQAYSQSRRVNTQVNWSQLETEIFAKARNAGFTEEVLAELSQRAVSSATQENPFQLLSGNEFFERAEKSENPREKLMFTLQGILRLIDERKFVEAEKKISDIEIKELRDFLENYLNIRASEVAIEQQNWTEFQTKANKVEDAKLQTFLWLKAAETSVKNKTFNQETTNFLINADKSFNKIEAEEIKAQSLLIKTRLVFLQNPLEARAVLSEAIKTYNKTREEFINKFLVSLNSPVGANFGFFLRVNFEETFGKFAEKDWFDTQSLIIQIEHKENRAFAQIAAAKAVL